MPDRCRAVVFDFDGVIAKSMELHAEAYRRILAPYDIEPSDRDIFLQEGARSETIVRDALKAKGHEADDETVGRLSDEKQRAFKDVGPPGLYEGARHLVEEVHRMCDKTALVTGTRRENLDHLIPELLPHFTAVLSQEDYSRDKPDPEPYAKAAEALDVPPGQCIAIENAIRGVQSAKAASYGHVVAITTTLDASDLVGADTVVGSHQEVLDAVRGLLS